MGLRDLVVNYKRDVRAAAGENVAAQIAWLEAKRVELSKEVDEGDWASESGSYEGQSHSSSRGIAARERLAAINSLLDQLTGENGGGLGGILIPQFTNIPH